MRFKIIQKVLKHNSIFLHQNIESEIQNYAYVIQKNNDIQIKKIDKTLTEINLDQIHFNQLKINTVKRAPFNFDYVSLPSLQHLKFIRYPKWMQEEISLHALIPIVSRPAIKTYD